MLTPVRNVNRTTAASVTMPVHPAKSIDLKQIRPGMTEAQIVEIGKTLASALAR